MAGDERCGARGGRPRLHAPLAGRFDSKLRHLHACWPERMSFVELARQIVQGGTPPGPDVGKLAAVAARFPAGPVLVRCLRHGTLRRDCPTQYPPGGPPDDALIVEDGNHRLTALALRLARGEPVPGDTRRRVHGAPVAWSAGRDDLVEGQVPGLLTGARPLGAVPAAHSRRTPMTDDPCSVDCYRDSRG